MIITLTPHECQLYSAWGERTIGRIHLRTILVSHLSIKRWVIYLKYQIKNQAKRPGLKKNSRRQKKPHATHWLLPTPTPHSTKAHTHLSPLQSNQHIGTVEHASVGFTKGIQKAHRGTPINTIVQHTQLTSKRWCIGRKAISASTGIIIGMGNVLFSVGLHTGKRESSFDYIPTQSNPINTNPKSNKIVCHCHQGRASKQGLLPEQNPHIQVQEEPALANSEYRAN